MFIKFYVVLLITYILWIIPSKTSCLLEIAAVNPLLLSIIYEGIIFIGAKHIFKYYLKLFRTQ